MSQEFSILITEPSKDYELLDSGDGEKLERYGNVVVSRPDPQALWKKQLPESSWQQAQAIFSRQSDKGEWRIKSGVPDKWVIELADLKFQIKLSAFKHTGIFPEQASNWKWIYETINNSPILTRPRPEDRTSGTLSLAKERDGKRMKVLNLFGYTGGATLAALKAGAEVAHLDGSRAAVTWAKDNAEVSGLGDKPVRWIVDDARAFLKREVKRESKYDAIVMDPPAFGRGPKGELWKIEEHFLDLLELCKQVLTDKPLFFLINGYASGYSALAYKNNLDELMKNFSQVSGTTEIGELTIQESQKAQRLLPAGIFARWKAQ